MTPDTTPEAVYLIRKHGGYYRPNARGYTTSAIVAGRYTQEQAERETHPNGPDGPRDGITYIHEKDVQGDEGWDAYRAKSIRIAELEAENAILRTEKHADAEAIAAMKEAGMDRLVAEGQRCNAMKPHEAAKVSAEDRENIVDEIESIICETHEMDVRDIDYAENIVSWLERHHPAALRAISEDSQ